MASEELQEELEGLTCSEIIKKLESLFEGEQEDAVDDCLDWFLFTYSPEYAFGLVQNNGDAFRDGLFLDITMSKIREIYEPEIFLESLNIVSCLEAYEQDIAKCGAVRAIIMMMGRDIHNERSQILGCKVLANLAHDLEVCKWVGKIKGIPRLLEILKRHAQTPDVTIEVCRTLTNLAFRCKQNKEIMHMEGTINVILSTISMDKSNEKLVNAGLRAIRNIVSEADEDFQFDETLLQRVLEAMTEFPQGLDIQTNCIWILVNLMSGKVAIKKNIVDHGGLDHILTAMENYDMDPHVQLAGSTALAILCKISLYRQLIPKKGGIQLLLTGLRTHRQIVPIQRSVLKAIYRISFNELNRSKLGDMKIVAEIMESMKVNHQSAPLQRIAILCLLKLTKNNKLKEHIQTKAVPLIIQARNNFSDIPHVHSVASAAVENLVSGSAASTTTLVPKQGSNKEVNTLRHEVKNLQNKEAEKDGTLNQLQEVVQTLETEVARLKTGMDLEVLNEMIKKISSKREVNTLKQQKKGLSRDLKKIQTEIDDMNQNLENGQLSPKDEDRKLKRTYASGTAESKKSSSPPIEKKEKRPSKSNSLKKIPKATSKQTQPKPMKSSKSATKIEKINDTENLEGSNEDAIIVSPDSSVTSTNQSTALITFSTRKSHSTVPPTTENIQEITKQIEELKTSLNQREQELTLFLTEKNKIDSVVNKLNMDVRATHFLIESLQKESLYHTQNREKLVTGNSLFSKLHKKLKGLKDQINTTNKENDELKKEILALGGDLSSLNHHNQKKKKKH